MNSRELCLCMCLDLLSVETCLPFGLIYVVVTDRICFICFWEHTQTMSGVFLLG